MFISLFRQKEGIMYISFQELFQLNNMKKAKLIAGKEGTNHLIRWYHIVEMENVDEWMEPHILALTTGVGFSHTQNDLKHMIFSLSKVRASGLIIGIGRYILDIDSEIIQYADELNFPLITIPGNIKYLSLTYELGTLILKKQIDYTEFEKTFKNSLINEKINNNQKLLSYGYQENSTYYICILQVNDNNFNNFKYEIIKMLKNISQDILYLIETSQIILFVPFKNLDTVSRLKNILLKMQNILKILSDNIFIGVSHQINNSSDIPRGYLEAKQALKISYKTKEIVFYQDFSLLGLIDMNKQDHFDRIINDYLGELIDHDDLLITIYTYLLQEMNMTKTANVLYIHINTLKYRMKKIKELLPVPLEGHNIYNVQTALYLFLYFKN